MKNQVNKKTICSVSVIIILLSALIYNILYINDKKNEIIDELEFEEASGENLETIIEQKTIFVDIGGEVNNPGLYELPESSRVNDAVNIAGGITDKADLTDVNLAYILYDAMKIIIPKKEVKKVTQKKIPPVVSTTITATSNSQDINTSTVNINTATKEQLKTLTGIGDSTAQKIIEYRAENGGFSKIEDVKNVSGIGESKFEKIKEKIII